MSTPALKEWAVVVHALLAGEQILDLRKGGIREAGGSFSLRAPRFWLYPTTEHEDASLVKPAYRRWMQSTRPPAERLRIEGWAEVAGMAEIREPEVVVALASKVIWTPEYVEQRLRWKRRDPLLVLALRTYRLVEPIDVAWRDEYSGCSSWVEIDDLPRDPSLAPSETALTEESFAARLELVERELPESFASVAR